MALSAMGTSKAGEGLRGTCGPASHLPVPHAFLSGLQAPCRARGWGFNSDMPLRRSHAGGDMHTTRCALAPFAEPDSPGSRRRAQTGSEAADGSDPGSRASQRTTLVGSQGLRRSSLPRPGERRGRKTEEQSPEAGENVTRSGRGASCEIPAVLLRLGWGGRWGADPKGSYGSCRGGWASSKGSGGGTEGLSQGGVCRLWETMSRRAEQG